MDTGTSHKELEIWKYYKTGESHRNFKKSFRRGGSFGVEAVRADMGAYQACSPAVSEFQIGMGLTQNPVANWSYGDGWLGETVAKPGSIIVIPPNAAVDYDVHHDHELLHIGCPSQTLQSMLDPYGMCAASVFNALTRHRFIYDVEVKLSMLAIWNESKRSEPSSGLLIDAHWQKIISKLLKAAHESPRKKTFGLTYRDIDTVTEFIRSNLPNSMATIDLANLVNLPIGQFSRDFKDATGYSPYQYVLRQRLLAAQDELAQGTKPLAKIAVLCRFSSQSHMTDVFREKLGCTPGTFRQSMKE